MKNLILLFLGFTVFFSCKEAKQEQKPIQEIVMNKGIADAKATELAERIMLAMGGQKKWDDLSYISWTFFGNRKLWWDKKAGRVRIENPRDTSVFLVDLNSLKGKYSKNGLEIKDDSILTQKMETAKNIWINDSYWLVMPFKLRDPGVQLKYERSDTMKNGVKSDVMSMTFNEVGVTPENKYEVYVDQTDNLIKQWDFYKIASQEEASRSWPWDNYKDFNGLLISTDRSDQSGPSEVKVYDSLDDRVFSELD